MSAIGHKWVVRRYQAPVEYASLGRDNPSLSPMTREQTFDGWSDVCLAMDVIVGDHDLKMNLEPSDPIVIKSHDDVILVYIKLEV